MLRLRKILLCNFFFYGLFLITGIVSIIRLSIPQESSYSEKTEKVTGKVISFIQKDEQTIIHLKTKEIIIGYTKNSMNEIILGDTITIQGEFHRISKKTINNSFYQVYFNKYSLIEKNHNLYYTIKQKIKERLQDHPYLNAFLMGEKSYLSEEAKRSYQENGISHLFAISGMHIALLASFIERLLKKKFTEETIFKITSIILIFYLILVGFSPSILRGVLFYICFSANQIYYFYINRKNLFLLILSLSLLYNPNMIGDIGFQYSYWISYSLLTMSDYLESNHYFISLLKTSFISFLSSIPITLKSFYQINMMGIFYNLLFVPFVSIFLFPFSFITFLIKPLNPLYNVCSNIMEKLSLSFSNVSFGKMIFPEGPNILYGIYFLCLFLFYEFRKRRYLVLFLILLMIHFFLPRIISSNYVQFLDVGQGDSTIIHLHHKMVMVDTGGINEKGTTFYQVLQPTLKKKGITTIFALVLTHGDHDHMGEAIHIVNHFKVENVIFNCDSFNDLEQELIKELKKKNIKYYSCIKELNIDEHTIYFLNTKEYDNENDNSNVLYLELNGYKFMIMGDAGIEREKDIIDQYNIRNIDVLKVGHHGSKTSSSKTFIHETNPKYSIISVGKNNRYGHPNKEVLNHLKESKIYRTDQDGNILFTIKNDQLIIKTDSS